MWWFSSSPATKKIAIGVANSDFLISRIERLFCFEYQAYIDSVYSSVDIVVNRLNSSCVIEVELILTFHPPLAHRVFFKLQLPILQS